MLTLSSGCSGSHRGTSAVLRGDGDGGGVGNGNGNSDNDGDGEGDAAAARLLAEGAAEGFVATGAADYIGSFAVEHEVATDVLCGLPVDARGDQSDFPFGSARTIFSEKQAPSVAKAVGFSCFSMPSKWLSGMVMSETLFVSLS